MTNKTESRQMDRYEGAMIGVAVGDALGAPLEFMTAERIRQEHAGEVTEMIGGGWLSVLPGEVTDDTQMTLAVAEGIVEAYEKYSMTIPFIGENFLRWYGTHPKDVGNTCASVLRSMKNNPENTEEEWHEWAKRLYYATKGGTAGNGALMRTIYPALWCKHTLDAEKAAVTVGRMTHWHETSDNTVRAYTEAVHTIANSDISPEEARAEMNRIMMTIKGFAEKENRMPPQPTGYCLDSLMCAIDAIDRTDSFEEALIYAVNLGGDADTIGAITGGLAGAIYGASAIPLRWTNALNNEPNRRTVKLFHDVQGPAAEKNANTILIRLVDLAHKAYQNHRKA